MKFFPKHRTTFLGYKSASKPKDVIRINANEGRIESNNRTYPLKRDYQLLNKFSKIYGVDPDNLLIDRGVDGILELIFQVFDSPETRVLTSYPTYGMYRILAEINGQEYLELPLQKNGQLHERFLLEASRDGQIIIICRPNNPTGNICPIDEVVSVLEETQNNSLVVLDEAYAEYLKTNERGLDLINKYSNLIVCRTLSKAYALAGLRVGFGIACPELVEKLCPFQSPYPVSSIVSDWLIKNFNEQWIERAVEDIKIVEREKVKLAEMLASFGDVDISRANFVNLYSSSSEYIYLVLKKNNIEVRHFPQLNLIRFSIGKDEELQSLYKVLKKEIRKNLNTKGCER